MLASVGIGKEKDDNESEQRIVTSDAGKLYVLITEGRSRAREPLMQAPR